MNTNVSLIGIVTNDTINELEAFPAMRNTVTEFKQDCEELYGSDTTIEYATEHTNSLKDKG